MLDVALATRLRSHLVERGRAWTPTAGDRFLIPDREIDDLFVVADMTIEVEELSAGRLIRFNGTTEWALDSIPAEEVVWVPWEHQLRGLLGDTFARLERLPGDAPGFAVVLADGSRHVDVDPEDAYARAVLAG